MEPLTIAALLVAQVGINPGVIWRGASVSRFGQYEECLKVKSAMAGAFSDEDPRTMVRAVRPQCAAEWSRFESAMLEGFPRTAENLRLLERYRNEAENVAMSELVEARLGSCGSQSGPYACRAPVRVP